MKNYLQKIKSSDTNSASTPTPHDKRRVRHPDRITLKAESLEKIDHWIKQVEPNLRGVKITRADIVNWLIMTQMKKLNKTQINQIEKIHFNPAKALQWAARKAKKALVEGDDFNLKEFIESNLFRSGGQKAGIHHKKKLRSSQKSEDKTDPQRERESDTVDIPIDAESKNIS